MASQPFETADMENSLVSYFLQETNLYNYIGISLTVALQVCRRIISKSSSNPETLERVADFIAYLDRVTTTCKESQIPVATFYPSMVHQLAHFYVSTISEWNFSGDPIWHDASLSVEKFYSHYIRNVQLKDDAHASIINAQDTNSKKAETARSKAPAAPQRPPVQPNRLAECGNWPKITQSFWPTAADGVWDLKLKHGPSSTWYASSEKPAPPASALPTPSYYANRGPSPTARPSGAKVSKVHDAGHSTGKFYNQDALRYDNGASSKSTADSSSPAPSDKDSIFSESGYESSPASSATYDLYNP